jgi:glycosyltransferase involved in cell wall biosynthesis
MRILHLGKFYPPHKGGMETVLRLVAEGLLAGGHEVRVLVAGDGVHARREDLPGAPGALLRAGVVATWQSQPLTVDLARLLRRELGTFAPDLVHLHVPNPLACAAWLAASATVPGRRRLPPLAVWHHADIVRQRLTGPLVRPVVRRCLDRAAGICVSSESLRQRARDLAGRGERVAVIPFGIDPRPLAATPTGEGPLLFVGRLVRYKGLDVLLRAVADLPRARLDIIGTGPQAPLLARRLVALRLQGRVRLLGEVPDADLPGHLARARALVLPSRDRSETFGLSLLEAMAAGVPVIASDLPTGVRELCRPGETGWLAAPGDARSLRAALAAALDDPDEARRRGARGRALVRARYTRDHMVAALVRWYGRLLDTTPAAPGRRGNRPPPRGLNRAERSQHGPRN